jgi:mannose-1-phosphate guanylyltransferase / mannose-6-phosphate isomerase
LTGLVWEQRRILKQEKISIIPIILCGGAGVRLWPASRDQKPKQFLTFGKDLSLFQDTVLRVADGTRFGLDFERPIISSGHAHRFLVAEDLRAIGISADIVLEPERRDSAAAIISAMRLAQKRNPDALTLILASDHAIPDTGDFLDHVARAAQVALAGRFTLFGIKPGKASVEYGYIQPGPAISGSQDVVNVLAFKEKPGLDTAEHYIRDGYLWNSGNFICQPSLFLDEAIQLVPEIANPAIEAADAGRASDDFFHLERNAFERAKALSIDFAVLEKTNRAAVLPSDFSWSDVGTWKAFHDVQHKDRNGNAVIGNGRVFDTANSLVMSDGQIVVLAGLQDVMVIATADAVLVGPIGMSAELKEIVGSL